MAIVFSAIVPHSPVLIPSIGKENLEKAKKTQEAYRLLEQNLYASKPDTVIIFGRHGTIYPEAININFRENYTGTFEDFGDFSTKLELRSDIFTIQKIRSCEEVHTDVSIILTSQEKIDYSASIPLELLMSHIKNTPIIPICESGQDVATHFHFGVFLKTQLSRINKRFAIVASGDLSHTISKNSPAGYSKYGKMFDKKLIQLIKNNDIQGMLNMDDALIRESGETCVKNLAMLFGTLNKINFQPHVISYEHPFGVGFLTAELLIQ